MIGMMLFIFISMILFYVYMYLATSFLMFNEDATQWFQLAYTTK